MCWVSPLIRSVKMPICTSGEPVSASDFLCSPITSVLRSFEIVIRFLLFTTFLLTNLERQFTGFARERNGEMEGARF